MAANANLALLIDADNVSAKYVFGLMAEIAKYGNASVRRIYGDFTDSKMKSWRECLLEYSINPVQSFAYTVGKNSTDGAMIIDAMDLLYKGRISGFCIVSSDSDFTRLAMRIREEGIPVYGFGEKKTPKPFLKACNIFTYLELLETDPEPPAPTTAQKPARDISPITPVTSKPATRSVSYATLQTLKRAVSAAEGEDGWSKLTAVGHKLRILQPDFDARTHGYDGLVPLVRATGHFELQMEGRNGCPVYYVRDKRNPYATTEPNDIKKRNYAEARDTRGSLRLDYSPPAALRESTRGRDLELRGKAID